MEKEKKYKCKMEFFRWGKKSNPLSWIQITSPTGNKILINIKLLRETPLPKKDVDFLEALAQGKEWPEKNYKMYSNKILKRFLEVSKI